MSREKEINLSGARCAITRVVEILRARRNRVNIFLSSFLFFSKIRHTANAGASLTDGVFVFFFSFFFVTNLVGARLCVNLSAQRRAGTTMYSSFARNSFSRYLTARCKTPVRVARRTVERTIVPY